MAGGGREPYSRSIRAIVRRGTARTGCSVNGWKSWRRT